MGKVRIKYFRKSWSNRSVSPWASPIVIIPKRSAPGEPPKRRLCVDYHVLNNLLTPVKNGTFKS